MRVALISGFVIALLYGPALAQMDPAQLQAEGERRERIENEKKYNETVRRTRTDAPQVKADPWRSVRPATTESKR